MSVFVTEFTFLKLSSRSRSCYTCYVKVMLHLFCVNKQFQIDKYYTTNDTKPDVLAVRVLPLFFSLCPRQNCCVVNKKHIADFIVLLFHSVKIATFDS